MKYYFLTFLIILSSNGVCAAPVFYDEMVDGDFPRAFFSGSTHETELSFDVGMNVVQGQIVSGSAIPDFVFFTFLIEDNQQLVGINAYWQPSIGSNNVAGFHITPEGAFSAFDSIGFIRFTSEVDNTFPEPVIEILFPLDSGRWNFNTSSTTGSLGSGPSDYRFEFIVSEVPLAPALMLYSSSIFLLMIGFITRQGKIARNLTR